MNNSEKTKVPKKITDSLKSWFDFPNQDVHCQVCTCSNNNPFVRTMKFYDITDDGTVIVLSRTNSKKWQNLQTTNNIAICICHLGRGQIVMEGTAKLETHDTNKVLIDKYWQMMDLYAMKIYTPSLQVVTKEIGENFGVIVVNPTRWEVFEPDMNEYLLSIRTEFRLENNQWKDYPLEPQ
jgi:general stress protein 26